MEKKVRVKGLSECYKSGWQRGGNVWKQKCFTSSHSSSRMYIRNATIRKLKKSDWQERANKILYLWVKSEETIRPVASIGREKTQSMHKWYTNMFTEVQRVSSTNRILMPFAESSERNGKKRSEKKSFINTTLKSWRYIHLLNCSAQQKAGLC